MNSMIHSWHRVLSLYLHGWLYMYVLTLEIITAFTLPLQVNLELV